MRDNKIIFNASQSAVLKLEYIVEVVHGGR